MFEVTQQGEVTLLRMAHGKANALDVEFCHGLTERLEEIKNSSTKALVLTGKGNIFSAGVDLVRVLEDGVEYLQALVPALAAAFRALFFFPKPVVAAVNGHAIAGGCVLACTADYRNMVDGRARMGVPELLVGVPFPTIALEIMRFATSSQNLQKLLYGGETFLPEEAAAMSLVDELAEPEDLLALATGMAEKLSRVSSKNFAITKRQIRQPVLDQVGKGESTFEPEIQGIWGSPETVEAMRSYVSRTLSKG